ncbi:hypothetical protein SASPL_114870 [Salvia splendens]|uniref:Ubiquitin-like protease family profile domain-containing protein n=1 Tax=Salvia splendens TaxID=180675 RepID=A0A8X9A0S1_SALSN|nr:hypothetical protein SASPL_114870 [Salvia splendens]
MTTTQSKGGAADSTEGNGGEAKGKEQANGTWRSSSKLGIKYLRSLVGKAKGKEKVDDDYKAPAASVNWGQDSTRNGPTEQAPRGQPSVVPAVPNPADEVEVVNRMKLRRSPKFLVEMMELLNENQQHAVQDMEFGHLIHFNITSIPSQLAYWLLYNFDHITCSVKVRGQRVHLTEEDVHMTMGFPRGEIMIVRSTRQDNQMMLDEIASVGDRNRYNMLPKFMQTQMLKDEDRWNSKLLRLREKHELELGGFGYGVIEAKYDPSRDNEVGLMVAKKKKNRAIVVERGESSKPKGVTEKGGTSNTKADDDVDHATDAMMALMEAASNAAKAISKLLRKMREAPDGVKGTGCFKIASTAALKMIGFKEPELINEHADPIASMTPTMEDEDIRNPAWIEAVEQMMKVVDERVALCKDDDIPTFDLGLRFASHDDANQPNNPIIDEQVPGMEHTLHTGGVIISSAVQDVLPNEEKDDSEEDNTQLALNVVHNLIDDFDFATPYVIPPGKREFTTSGLRDSKKSVGSSSHNEAISIQHKQDSTIVSRTNPWDAGADTQLATFAANLDHEVKLIPNFKWADIDMVFFPICAHEHYYAVCFYYASKRVIVIDNSSSGDSDNITVNYGVIPETLKYLAGVGCAQQSKAVENSAIKRLKLKWSTETNKDDNGVYLMRHLETYMGQKGREWTCGLSKKSKGVLQILRAKYCTALMLAKINHEHFKNKAKVIPYYANALQTKKIDEEKLIANYAKGANLFN